MSNGEIDVTPFRRALGCFATGVAVATTLDNKGAGIGMTISSFNSVSMNPPLILWSIACTATSYDDFLGADCFAVNVLTAKQKNLSEHFARSGPNEFDGISHYEGLQGVPLIPECAAVFECRTEHRYEGGDHTIIVGRVERFIDSDADALLFYRGRFLAASGPYAGRQLMPVRNAKQGDMRE